MRLSRYRQAKLDAAYARADRETALRKQDGRCAYCLVPLTLKTVTRDHVKPRSAGGSDHPSNIKAACYRCNQVKGSIPYNAFMRMICEPAPLDPIEIHLVWSDRRINKALIRLKRVFMLAIGAKE